MIVLSDLERERFAVYLSQGGDSDEAMARQVETLPGMSALSKKLRTEAMAARIIVAKLMSTETQAV